MATKHMFAVGFRVNSLTVTGEPVHRGRFRMIPCRCDCGRDHETPAYALASGKSKSCGKCPRIVSDAAKKAVGDANRKHGRIGTPEYGAWSSMKKRCLNPSHAAYARYGGRGIDVDPRWVASFETFLADMGERPDGMTLERDENDCGYWPDNCRWADRSAQNKNRRPFTIVRYGKPIMMHKPPG